MNKLQNFSQNEKTMTSKEIAELTGKRHDHVMRDIKGIFQRLENQSQPSFGVAEYKDAQGKPREMYILTKKETLLLISGYNVNLRMAIINRWEELENSQPLLPTDYLSALKMLVVSTEERILLAKENETLQIEKKENAPKVHFFDTVVESSDVMSMDVVAKMVNTKMGRNKLFEFLRKEKVLQKNNVPYQKYVTLGYFKLVESSYIKKNREVGIGFKTVAFQKGVDFIIKLYKSKNE